MRLCSGAGCGRKIEDKERYCDECKAEHIPHSDGDERKHVGVNGPYDEQLDKLRKGPRWQKVRAIAIRRCPICARCQIRLSEIVDHIVPAWVVIEQARQSGLWPFDRWAGYYLLSNLQGMCRPCHAVKTAEDKAHVGPWPNAVEKGQAAPKKVWSF
jgi:5-methylcytosine-specific restriction endonuclease McrA